MNLRLICRGSPREGLGHLARAKTFAQVAGRHHQVELLAIAPPGLEFLLSGLSKPPTVVEKDRDLLPLIEGKWADIQIFDVVSLEEEVMQQAKESALLSASLSPVFDHMDRVDVVFTRSPKTELPPNVVHFGGLEYAIFGDQCAAIGQRTYEANLAVHSLPIGVSMGGADASNKTLSVVRALVQMDFPLTILVLLGEGYTHSYDALVDCARTNQRHEVILAKTNQSMWRILANSVVAVMAGGLTTVEAVHAGLPTINIFERQEHLDAMNQDLFQAGVCLNGGLFSEKSLQTMTRWVRVLNSRRHLLLDMRRRAGGLVDKRGPERVVTALEDVFYRGLQHTYRLVPQARAATA